MAQRKNGSGRVRRRLRPGTGGTIGRVQVVACVLVVLALGCVGVGLSLRSGGFEVSRTGGSGEETSSNGGSINASANGNASAANTSSAQTSAATTVSSETGIVVHVDGAVACPGVYDLMAADPRVRDAIAAAGGLASEADTSNLNLAARIADGSKVHVPTQGEVASGDQPQSSAGGATTGSSGTGGTSSGLVNINTATAEELDALPGVGPSTAEAIVEDRERNGPFASTEDLMRVSGIGEKKYAKLEGSICV